mmetsp:Transcript_34165/g.71930  ORF Transcript_34165/g.71930 Transcript_34165/m.71930 type:complete len:370 (-) Transcript_34165:286-1395(-)|eukprot:CAMPEP_0183726320 /NCGR_PEP_ID=MMETSP0737-20130205/23053_1 /TAXON_ID=385413 /ORGANISM="Thalassiosira miniscula, Strain CCMP1093" /LENGTH=369 /DNA_ID=CAMNT_0025957637 /DNA_START=155 /DNA_END=1264 /DNA_ORIENTATION=+
MPSPTCLPRFASSASVALALLAAILLRGSHAFTSSSSSSSSSSKRKAAHHGCKVSSRHATKPTTTKTRPSWVPWELVELASEDLSMTQQDFVQTYADIEAYTSCDDEGDEFHECDFFNNYLGPTKWLHLTPLAKNVIDEVHFAIWREVWTRPRVAVDLADKVSKECLRYYNEFMLEQRPSSIKCPTDRPLVRVKVVPASFGLEGFEDAVWEATQDLIESSSVSIQEQENTKEETAEPPRQNGSSISNEYCKAITFIVAAPDLFTDPTLLAEGENHHHHHPSPQMEFEPDRFREFVDSTLREKMRLFSQMEHVSLDNFVELTSFHPLWKEAVGDTRGEGSDHVQQQMQQQKQSFPYPCVAVSTNIESIDE